MMKLEMERLKKLKRLSRDEWGLRAAQALAARAERYGWSKRGRLPDDAALLRLLDAQDFGRPTLTVDYLREHFRVRRTPHFFASFDRPAETLGELSRRFGASAADSTIDCARRLVAGRFDLLGFKEISFGDPVNWHLEPIAGKETPLKHWSEIDYLDPEVAGDKKIIWELNRHQYFATLGRAYWQTGNEVFAQTFVAHLDAWMNSNPPKVGINWASSLEVAFRSISWLWAFYFFRDSPSLSDDTFVRALKFLYLHARHLETYLSTYFSPNTHLTGEALGLFYLGTLLPEFKEAQRWRDTGRKILLTQLSQQVRRDGVYFEQSSYYHRYTTDFYMHFLILSRVNQQRIPDAVEKAVGALLDHIMYVTRPDGTVPFFGDDDGGRLVMLDQRAANDFRASLATGASLLGRGDYKFVAEETAEETLWLLGQDGLNRFDSLPAEEPAQRSVAFENGGYYVMRDGWTSKANYLLFDCGPHGELSCGHAHADALSFELAVKGRTLLVDPGTYTYTGSKQMRDWFRSSVAHNTLTIDGESSSLTDGAFSWRYIAECETAKWISRERFDYVEGRHNGYSRLQQPVAHGRSILFLKEDYWIIRDELNTKGEHRADLWFHFDSGATPLIEALDEQTATIVEHDGQVGMNLFAFAPDGRWRREDGWVSHCYGEKTAARVYVYSVPIRQSTEVITFLLPQADAAGGMRMVRETEAVAGKAFEVTHENGLDVVMIRSGQRVETARLVSDFAWTWARFSNEETMPTELLLLQGTTLELEGRLLLHSEKKIDYLRARQVGDQFKIETNEGEVLHPVSDFERAFSRLPFMETRRSPR